MKRFAILFAICIAITLGGCSKDEPIDSQKSSIKPAAEPVTATKGAVDETRQVAEQASEKVSQVAQQVEEKAVATAGQINAALNSGQAIYAKTCLPCHKFGISGAPKTGDKKIWAALVSDGKELLIKNAINGIGKMPAKGGDANLTNAEVEAAVEYMLDQSR